MIGEEVRRRREGLGLTGAQLAARAGMAPSAVSQIETGKRTPSSTSVIKLATALGVEVGDLYPKGQSPLPLDASESAAPRAWIDELRANAIPIDELSDEDLADVRRVLAGGAPKARFVDEEEDLLGWLMRLSGQMRQQPSQMDEADTVTVEVGHLLELFEAVEVGDLTAKTAMGKIAGVRI